MSPNRPKFLNFFFKIQEALVRITDTLRYTLNFKVKLVMEFKNGNIINKHPDISM